MTANGANDDGTPAKTIHKPHTEYVPGCRCAACILVTGAGEKPLHVRVAEALGWTECGFYPAVFGHTPPPGFEDRFTDKGYWCGFPPLTDPIQAPVGVYPAIPRFDTDWSATGPLIEKYGFVITPAHIIGVNFWLAKHGQTRQPYLCPTKPGIDKRVYEGAGGTEGQGHTALLAVCNLILELTKLPGGKLIDKPATNPLP